MNKKRISSWYIFGGALLLLTGIDCTFFHKCYGQDNWAVASIASYHINRPEGSQYNAGNHGIGIERTDNALSYAAGTYRNSWSKQTTYLLTGYAPFQVAGARIGIIGGLVNHYPELNNGGIGPVVAGLIRIEGEKFGTNVMILPRIPGRTPWTVGFQIKVKL